MKRHALSPRRHRNDHRTCPLGVRRRRARPATPTTRPRRPRPRPPTRRRPTRRRRRPAHADADETAPAETVSVPVFFVADTPQGPASSPSSGTSSPTTRSRRPRTDDRPATRPTLTTGRSCPGGRSTPSRVRRNRRSGLFSVKVADDGWTKRPAGMSKADAKLAVQQIVYTLQTWRRCAGARPRQGRLLPRGGAGLASRRRPLDLAASDELSTRAWSTSLHRPRARR